MAGGFARIPYVRRCVLQRNGRRAEAVLCDLSVLGVYVTFLRPLPEAIPEPGETVSISFLLPEDPVPVEGDATVTWQNVEERQEVAGLPPGCGLRFVSLHPSHHSRIDELIQDYRSSPHPRISVPPPHTGFVRIPYVQPCLLVNDAGTWEGVLCNLSLVGAYVTTDPIPPTGERLGLLFKVPGEDRPLEARGEVVWVNPEEPRRADSLPPGCGLRFEGLDPAVRAHVARLIVEYESIPRDTS